MINWNICIVKFDTKQYFLVSLMNLIFFIVLSPQNWTPPGIYHSIFEDGNSSILNQQLHPNLHTNSAEKFDMAVNKDEKNFYCKICPYSTSKKSHMTYHLRKHTGEKPFICGICNAGFSTKCNLTTHLRIHNSSEQFKCSLCSYSAAQKASLIYHMKKNHCALFQMTKNEVKNNKDKDSLMK